MDTGVIVGISVGVALIGIPSFLIIGVYIYTRVTCGRFRPRRKIDLTGQISIVTGANTGIGYITALEFARLGATVVLACRDRVRAEAAREKMIAQIRSLPSERTPLSTERPESVDERLIFLHLDLASLASVRTFASEFRSRFRTLHILVNNAGVMFIPNKTLTADGFEMQMGVNHLGHFLLTNLLMPTLEVSGPARIVNVSSMAHSMAHTFPVDDLNRTKRRYHDRDVYAETKLANILFTRELHKRLISKHSVITVNALHPGLVRTELPRYSVFYVKPFMWLLGYICGKSAEEGSQTTLYCALSDELENVSGQYFSDCKVKRPSRLALNDELATKLWQESEQLTGLNARSTKAI